MFLAKFAGLFFGYKVCKFWESGEGAPYEGVGGAPPTMAPDFNNGSGSSEPAPGSMAPSMGGGNPYQAAWRRKCSRSVVVAVAGIDGGVVGAASAAGWGW